VGTQQVVEVAVLHGVWELGGECLHDLAVDHLATLDLRTYLVLVDA
ncbi:MAG: hypothetical protein GY854_33000, partial [Deltaproteobacteria bacterium]|nr:hypothetical protein [Deltaproteobacteria bacterium]